MLLPVISHSTYNLTRVDSTCQEVVAVLITVTISVLIDGEWSSQSGCWTLSKSRILMPLIVSMFEQSYTRRRGQRREQRQRFLYFVHVRWKGSKRREMKQAQDLKLFVAVRQDYLLDVYYSI
jgi:hypothetical protein